MTQADRKQVVLAAGKRVKDTGRQKVGRIGSREKGERKG